MKNEVVYDAVQDVKAVAEYNGGGIETLLNGRVVKNVQRGNVNTRVSIPSNFPNDGHSNLRININEVTPNKAILFGNFELRGNAIDRDTHEYAYIDMVLLEKSNINVRVGNSSSGNSLGYVYGEWQVIEFY